jgi:protein-S-isoprenylcysteine O-methyltransferase Ste14
MLKCGRVYSRYKDRIDQGLLTLRVVMMYVQVTGLGIAISYSILQSLKEERALSCVKVVLVLSTSVFFLLWVRARLTLGLAFAFTPAGSDEATPLVTEGLYSWFSCPMYIFSALTFVSFVLVIDRPVYLYFLLVLVPVQCLRARMEAERMHERHGQEYEAYMQNVWF